MTIPHLISTQGHARFQELLQARPLLLAFDLDGTLAPLVTRPEDAAIPDEIMNSLVLLEGRTHLAILSGRGRSDIIRLCRPLARTHFIGNHGLEHPGVPESVQTRAIEVCQHWRRALEKSGILGESGVFLEDKGSSLSIHYRESRNPMETRESIERVSRCLDPAPKLIAGKFVVNLTPLFAPLKGDALAHLKAALGAEGILFAGDDVTDEHAFEWLRDRPPGDLGFGVHIGANPATQAHFRLDSISEVSSLLRALVEKLS